jgi:predicted short-subunit dehydrogenase-like oxidoreductase (DUF2520 family)
LRIDDYRFCVIGPGRLGSTLLIALDAAGLTVTSVGIRGDDDALGAAAGYGAAHYVRVVDAALESDAWWLAVPDDDIFAVAGQIASAYPGARRPGGAPLAIHSSGLGSVRSLRPLRDMGALTLCLHPLQTFSGDPRSDSLAGVACAVTAEDEPAEALGEELAARLGMRPFRLEDDRKPLYHLAAAISSNLLVALESEAIRLMNEATGREDGLELLAPLLAQTAGNVVTRGPSLALTGPLARGDVATVRAHLRLLAKHTSRLADAYRALSLEALTLAAPRLDDEAVRALKTLLEEGEGTPTRDDGPGGPAAGPTAQRGESAAGPAERRGRPAEAPGHAREPRGDSHEPRPPWDGTSAGGAR